MVRTGKERIISDQQTVAFCCLGTSLRLICLRGRVVVVLCAAMFAPADLFDLTQTEHAALFKDCRYAWDALKKLKEYLKANLKPACKATFDGQAHIGEQVFIGEGTVIEDGVMIKGPAIIGRNCEFRHNAR